MFKILTLNNISVKGLERLPRDKYEIAQGRKPAEAQAVGREGENQ